MNVQGASTSGRIEQATIEATVIRCGCTDGGATHLGYVCPRPRTTEDLGIVSFYHRNPLKRLTWAVKNRKGAKS